jgi:hypothetical protein
MMDSHAIGKLLRHLPDNLHGLWLEVNQLHNILKLGGFPLLPKSVVAKCLKANRESIQVIVFMTFIIFTLSVACYEIEEEDEGNKQWVWLSDQNILLLELYQKGRRRNKLIISGRKVCYRRGSC